MPHRSVMTPVLLLAACLAPADREPARPTVGIAIHVVEPPPSATPPATAAPEAPAGPPAMDPTQREAYEARRPKSILENQPWRTTTRAAIPGGEATLVDLQPNIGVWCVLSVTRDDGTADAWHLENPSGRVQPIRLVPEGLSIAGVPCPLWDGALDAARASGQAYGPLCDGRLAVRNPTEGHKTRLEWTTDFLRDHVWGGDEITNMVKETLYVDSQLVTGAVGDAVPVPVEAGSPKPARVAPGYEGRRIEPTDLGLPLDGPLAVGAWYPFAPTPGAWVSLVQAGLLADDIKDSPDVRRLSSNEAAAMVYTVAFDLSRFDLGYEVGTDHPRVDWSYRSRAPRLGLAGPDGFGSLDPLVRTGLLDPAWLPREAAVFVGGFKREHGAFRSGPLAKENEGSHYGFIEFGTELSRLQPGLATVYVDADGRVDMKTWTDADSTWSVRHARQNGVALVEPDENGVPRPGPFVRQWKEGNWSGSAEGELRTVRSGLCVQESDKGRFLLYSYFSGVTPSAMADVFMGYDCRYAMMLDINALEHTYLALRGDGDRAEHLVNGMEVLDYRRGKREYQRWVGYADNRDFFYVLKKAGR